MEIKGNGSHGMSFEGTEGRASSTLTNFWDRGNRVWDITGYGIRVNANTDRWVIDRNHGGADLGAPTQSDAILVAKVYTSPIVEDNRWFTVDVTVPAL